MTKLMVVKTVQTHPLSYLTSRPPSTETEGGVVPVLCFLHGLGEAAPMEIRNALTRHGPLRAGSSPKATDRFIVICPQLPVRGDVWLKYADEVWNIVTKAHQDYSGDPRRTYLTGFSYGGNGVLDIGTTTPGRWAALWPVDPTRPPASRSDRPVWLSFGEHSRRNGKDFIEGLSLRPAAEDPAGDFLYTDSGEDHVGAATSAYGSDEVYDWLLTKQSALAGRFS